MPFVLTCPVCTGKIKTARALPATGTVQCSKCKEIFEVSRGNMEELVETKTETSPPAHETPAPPKPAATAIADPAHTLPQRPQAIDDIQNLRAEPEAPATEPEDELRADDDEERPRTSLWGEEVARTPRRRKKFRAERPRRGKGKKLTNRLVRLGLTALALLTVTSLAFSLFRFYSRGVDAELIAMLPADTSMLAYDDVEYVISKDSRFKNKYESDLNRDPKYARIKAGGIAIEDITRILGALTQKGESITLVRFKKPIDKELATEGGAQAKAGNVAYWKFKDEIHPDSFIAFPSNTVAVIGSSEDVMKAVLERQERKIAFSSALQELMGKVKSGSQWCASLQSDLLGPETDFDVGAADSETVRAISSVRAAAVKVNARGGSLEIVVFVQYDTPDSASKAFDFQRKKIKVVSRDVADAPPLLKSEGLKTPAYRRIFPVADMRWKGEFIEHSRTFELGASNNVDALYLP